MRGNDPKKFTDNNHLGVPKTLDRKKLHRRSPYSAWDIWLIGLFSIGIGVVLTYTALFGENGFIKNISFPMFVWFLFFLSITILFARVFFLGLVELNKHRRILRQKKNDPNAPWLYDFENNLEGAIGSRLRYSIWEEFLAVFVFLLFISLFGFMMDFKVIWTVIVSIALICLMFYQGGKGALENILNLSHYFKFGKGRFVFTKFPFYLGSTLQAKVSNLPPKEKINDLVLKLRFIQEEIIDSSKVNFLEYFLDQKIFSIQDLDVDGNLPIEWPLPDNPEFTTNLSERPAKYWELEVKAETSGVDYHERFLLPVYAKP
jgi:hypothetical protein